MKATLSFNLPEDREQFDMAANGELLWCAFNDLFAWLRRVEKYEDRETLTVDEVQKKISYIMADNGGNLEALFD